MGKRALQTGQNNPTVRLADRVGSRFVGKYVSTREIKIKGKPSKVHELAVVDGDALITIKDGSTFKEATVKPGDLVTLFGSKAIDTAISQARVGETLEFIFNGVKGKSGYHDYAVAVLEDA